MSFITILCLSVNKMTYIHKNNPYIRQPICLQYYVMSFLTIFKGYPCIETRIFPNRLSEFELPEICSFSLVDRMKLYTATDIKVDTVFNKIYCQ